MRVEAVTNAVPDQARDPRWPWVITAAQLQRMTFPDEPSSGRGKGRRATTPVSAPAIETPATGG